MATPLKRKNFPHRMYWLTIFFLYISLSTFSQKLSVYFELDSHVLADSELNKLSIFNDEIYRIVRVESFCDSSGSIPYNRKLAEKRAQYVQAKLRSASFEIKIIGKEYQMNNSNYNPKEWRKVDIHYVFSETAVYEPLEAIETPQKVETIYIKSIFNDSIHLANAIAESEPIVLNIQFIPGSNQLFDENSYNELWRLFYFLKDNASMHAFIRGHVCCGSSSSLSFERAYTVYQFLTQRGISPKRLKYQGFDNSIPISLTENTEEERQMNRRVDVIFTPLSRED